MSSGQATPVLIDCDPGLDDAVALLLALRSPEIDVVAATAVSGNLPAKDTFGNLHRILTFADRTEIPTGRGPDHPLVGRLSADPFSHGPGGLGGHQFPEPSAPAAPAWAPEVICAMAAEYGPDLVLVTLGPLTNLALALKQDPALTSKVSRLVMLGGNFGYGAHGWRNGTGDNPVSEWNVYVDPEAAALVLEAGFHLTAVGLDAATDARINLNPQQLGHLDAGGAAARFAAEMVRFVEGRGFDNYCALIDSVAVAAAVRPSLVTTEAVRCGVEVSGQLTRGMTVVDQRHHHAWQGLALIDVATSLDHAGFQDLLLERLGAQHRSQP